MGALRPILLLVGCATLLSFASALSDIEEELDHVLEGWGGEYGENGEDDIIMNPDMEGYDNKRKAYANTFARWPVKSGMSYPEIDYRFGDTEIDQDLVRAGIVHWEQNTCLTFREVADDFTEPHLIFRQSNVCNSYVGRVAQFQGQTVNLATGCQRVMGIVAHEIGHAMGFWHEQSRSDRDNYVMIKLENIIDANEHNFDKKSDLNYSVPYDYTSVMHYGAYAFTENSQQTIVTKNILAQSIIGSRAGLSFMDILLANRMYSCNNKWAATCSYSEDPCQNNGFMTKECTCRCPAGTSGSMCEILIDIYQNAILTEASPDSKVILMPGFLTNPGHPTPLQRPVNSVYWIRAANCQRIKITVNAFQLYRNSSSGFCNIDRFEIRNGSDIYETGHQFCDTQLSAGDVFISSTNEAVILFKSYDYESVSSYTNRFIGFNVTIEFIDTDECTTTPPPTTTTSTTTTTTTSTTTTTTTPSPPTIPEVWNFTRRALTVKKPNPCRKVVVDTKTKAEVAILGPKKRKGTCNIAITSKFVSLAKVTLNSLDISGSETLQLRTVGAQVIDFQSGMYQVGDEFYLPSSAMALKFSSGTRNKRNPFRLTVLSLANSCQQKVKLTRKGSKVIEIPDSPYPENAFCEWRIQAPKNKKVKLTFNAFGMAVKPNTTDCSSDCLMHDYVAVAKTGSLNYISGTDCFCGSTIPAPITGGRNVNVIVNGRMGGAGGVRITLRAV